MGPPPVHPLGPPATALPPRSLWVWVCPAGHVATWDDWLGSKRYCAYCGAGGLVPRVALIVSEV